MDPLRFLSAHSLLNLESIVTLAFLVGLVMRSGGAGSVAAGSRKWPIYVGLCAAIVLFYWRVLDAPFVYDDYTHIADARRADWRSIWAAFGPVENPPGLFFRPFGFLVYWVNYLVAGEDPRLWHAVSLAFHALNAILVYSLCRTLPIGSAGSLGAALVFAFSGSATEPVAWIDARFDPMATALVLASLLCVCRFLDSGGVVWMVGAALAGAAGFATKESTFCLPLLVACLWFFRPAARVRLIVALLSVGAVAAMLFAYRWWALGGIGGYRGPSGDSNLESFSFVRMLNAILVRDWTILFFPVNWSHGVGWMVAVFLCLTPVVLGLCVYRARVPTRAIVGALAMTIAAGLPVQHLLLIGFDLANTRYVYLLAVGWAILWGAIFAGIRGNSWRWFAIGWMVALHLLLAHHNLAFWLRVPEESRTVCSAFGQTLAATQGSAVVGGLPQRKDGVVFLANGFPECVEMNSHLAPGRVTVFGTPNFVWNSAAGRIEPAPAQ